jgi:hypothetical protein
MVVCNQGCLTPKDGQLTNAKEEGNPPLFSAEIQPESPQIVILGVAGSNPVSHPLFGSHGPCSAEIRRGESSSEYHGDTDWLNCSSAKTAVDSPVLYYQRHVARSLPPLSSSSLTVGTLVHEWLELGDPVLDTWASPPEETLTPTGAIGKEAKKYVADNFGPNATIVSPSDLRTVRRCIAAVKANRAACELIERVCERELSVRWETADGDRLRCRFDCLTEDGLVLDLKTTREADIARNFWKAVLDYKYHFSDAWYRRGMEACGMEPAPLRYIVVSTVPPHDCQVVTLPAAVHAEGQRLMDATLADLRLRTGLNWWLPDHHGEVLELSFPAYSLGRFA